MSLGNYPKRSYVTFGILQFVCALVMVIAAVIHQIDSKVGTREDLILILPTFLAFVSGLLNISTARTQGNKCSVVCLLLVSLLNMFAIVAVAYFAGFILGVPVYYHRLGKEYPSVVPSLVGYLFHNISVMASISAFAFCCADLHRSKGFLLKPGQEIRQSLRNLMGVSFVVLFLLCLINNVVLIAVFLSNLLLVFIIMFCSGQFILYAGISILVLQWNNEITKHRIMNMLIASVVSLLTSIPSVVLGVLLGIEYDDFKEGSVGYLAACILMVIFGILGIVLSSASIIVSSTLWNRDFEPRTIKSFEFNDYTV